MQFDATLIVPMIYLHWAVGPIKSSTVPMHVDWLSRFLSRTLLTSAITEFLTFQLRRTVGLHAYCEHDLYTVHIVSYDTKLYSLVQNGVFPQKNSNP